MRTRGQEGVGREKLGKVDMKLGNGLWPQGVQNTHASWNILRARYQEVNTQCPVKLARDELPCEAPSRIPSLPSLSLPLHSVCYLCFQFSFWIVTKQSVGPSSSCTWSFYLIHGHSPNLQSSRLWPVATSGARKKVWMVPANLALLLEKTKWNHKRGSVQSLSARKDKQ